MLNHGEVDFRWLVSLFDLFESLGVGCFGSIRVLGLFTQHPELIVYYLGIMMI